MNDRGMMVGESYTADGHARVFMWHDGEMTDVGALGGDTSRAVRDLNEWGQVVGMTTDADGRERGFLWYQGEMVDLGIGGVEAGPVSPLAINNWGQVVGVGGRQ